MTPWLRTGGRQPVVTLLVVLRFRELSGGEVVLRVLGDIKRGEEERREAAGVLAQILSPWIDGNTNIQEIDCALTDIVISLKGRWDGGGTTIFILLGIFLPNS